MDHELGADDVVHSINRVLIGEWTVERLGVWAHHALVNDLAGAVKIDHRHRQEVGKVLERLMALAEESAEKSGGTVDVSAFRAIIRALEKGD